jgi:hypothetical protein
MNKLPGLYDGLWRGFVARLNEIAFSRLHLASHRHPLLDQRNGILP